MTDDEIRAWLTEEIEREDAHVRDAERDVQVRMHCAARREAFRELLDILNRATQPPTEDCATCADVVYAEGAK